MVGAIWPNGGTGGGNGPVTVHLISGPIHYDFLLPADDDTLTDLAFAQAGGVPLDMQGVQWIVVGWGARDFYTSTGAYTDLRAGAVWRAIVGDQSVLHVSVAGEIGQTPVQTLHLSHPEYQRLKQAILSSVPDPKPIATGFGAWDAFFTARGRFHIFRTCNVWVSQVMQRAGLRFGRWTPVPFAVTLSAKLYQ